MNKGPLASQWETKRVGENQSSKISLLRRASLSLPKPRPLWPPSRMRSPPRTDESGDSDGQGTSRRDIQVLSLSGRGVCSPGIGDHDLQCFAATCIEEVGKRFCRP